MKFLQGIIRIHIPILSTHIALGMLAFFAVPLPAAAQEDHSAQVQPPAEEFIIARITSTSPVIEEGGIAATEYTLEIARGERKNEVLRITERNADDTTNSARFFEGQRVIVLESTTDTSTARFITGAYRIPALIILFIGLCIIAVIIARRKALFALLGMSASIIILVTYILPGIATGANPLTIGIFGILVLAVLNITIGHGWNRQSHIALAGTVISIALAAIASWAIIQLTQLTGAGSEEAYSLQLTIGTTIELRGLLFVGILIGALGVLDDITTSLAATVTEIHKANPSLTARELYTRGLRVGQEHIVSLINTLVLAYAGAALPMLLLIHFDAQPLWVTLNSEYISEEIIRALIGSAALMIAVPITTAIAARVTAKR